jgi:thymidylate kinase
MTDFDTRPFDGIGHDDPALAPLIAVIGSDGAGKTTLAAALCATLEKEGAAYAYLGLGSGTLGLKIQAWPVIGPVLARRLTAKAKQARTKGERIPGVLTALVIYVFSKRRVRGFKRMLALRKQAGLVICDRYPQLDVAGFYDGPGLSAARPGNRFTAWLAKREITLYQRMVSYRPTLVIRLNIDADTAFARKPDHNLALLRHKVEATPLLRFNGARIVEVDASQPQIDVQAQCLQLVRELIAR